MGISDQWHTSPATIMDIRLGMEQNSSQLIFLIYFMSVNDLNFPLNALVFLACVCVCVCVCYLLSYVWLFITPQTVAHQASLSMGFSRQEYWSGLPFPSPEDLPDPGIEPWSPALQEGSLPSEPPRKP